MSTTTPNLSLTLYDSTTDQSVTFATFRAVWGGTATTSNFYRIDTWAGTVNSSISTLTNQRGSIPVSASYISANYYEASVASITSYISGMTIILSVDATSDGTVTLNINSLGTKSVMKVDETGTPINLTGSDLVENRRYLFEYDGTRWLWVSANSADQIQIVGTAGNVVTVGSNNELDGSTTPSSLISSTVNSATSKTTPVDADGIGLVDSADSNVLKKLTWANLKATFMTSLGSLINGLSAKTIPNGADTVVINDSENSNATKQVVLSNLYKALGTGTQDSTTYLRGDGTYSTVTSGAGVDGWVVLNANLSYSSADSPSFVVSSDTNITNILSVGNKIKFTNNATTFYGIVTSLGSWSGSSQLITIYGGTDYTVASSSITSPYYSSAKSPLGFPVNEGKWTVVATNTSLCSKASPTVGTWYGGSNLTPSGISISAPIGLWKASYIAAVRVTAPSASIVNVRATLSNANNTQEDSSRTYNVTFSNLVIAQPICSLPPFLISVSSKTTYYLNIMTNSASMTSVEMFGDQSTSIISLLCAYL